MTTPATDQVMKQDSSARRTAILHCEPCGHNIIELNHLLMCSSCGLTLDEIRNGRTM